MPLENLSTIFHSVISPTGTLTLLKLIIKTSKKRDRINVQDVNISVSLNKTLVSFLDAFELIHVSHGNFFFSRGGGGDKNVQQLSGLACSVL